LWQIFGVWWLNIIAAMKTPLLLAASIAFLLQSPSHAADGGSFTFIKTNYGKVYTNCRVVQTDPDGVLIFHQNGCAKLLFENLPEDARATSRLDELREG